MAATDIQGVRAISGANREHNGPELAYKPSGQHKASSRTNHIAMDNNNSVFIVIRDTGAVVALVCTATSPASRLLCAQMVHY